MRFAVVRRLLAQLRGQRGLVVVSSACRVLNFGLGVAIPAIAVALLAEVAEARVGLGAALAILVVLALVKGTFRYLEQYTGHAVAFRLLADLRSSVFRWLERLEPGRLREGRAGDLVARVSADIDRVEPFYAHTLAPAIAAVAVPVITLVGLGLVAGPPPAVVLTPFVIAYLAIVPWIGSKWVAQVGLEGRSRAGETAAEVADVVQGAAEVAVLGAGERVVERIGESDMERATVDRRLARLAAHRSLLGGLISAGAIASVALVGVVSDLGLQMLAVSVVVAWTIWSPLRALEQIVPDTEQSLAAAARLFDLQDREPQTSGDTRPQRSGEVRFDAVTVRSGPKTLVEDASLTVPEGIFLGVVGPSGSGKTTLIETLVRNRDVASGVVSLGGTPITELAPSALSDLVAIVPQRPDVFHGTIATNLRLADHDADDDELRRALARAGLLEWVDRLDQGLDTSLGERGVGMSGGQMQRLALARALLRDPSVLVLDEATSELDAVAERKLLEQVYAERGRRTLIVVAHRMETVVPADVIAVMNRGRIVELGSHEELLGGKGLYAALWERHLDMLSGV